MSLPPGYWDEPCKYVVANPGVDVGCQVESPFDHDSWCDPCKRREKMLIEWEKKK